MSVSLVSAQYVVRGTVVDKYKNPIVGARVEMDSGHKSIVTKSDGTFRMENNFPIERVHVYYKGMYNKVQEAKPSMVVEMLPLEPKDQEVAYSIISRANIKTNSSKKPKWQSRPDKYSWLVSAQMTTTGNKFKRPSLGAMVGMMKTFGWYVKGVYNSSPSTDVTYENLLDISPDLKEDNKDKYHYYAFTGGALFRIKSSPICFYAGLGYAYRKAVFLLSDGKYAKISDSTYSGLTTDYGMILKFGILSINGGTMMSLADGCHFVGNLGLGVCF